MGALALVVVVGGAAVALVLAPGPTARGRLVGGVLSAVLPGHVRLGPTHLGRDGFLTAHDVFIDAPEGTTVIAARHVRARLVPGALLRGRLCFDPVVVTGAHVNVVQAGGGRLPIERAFVPEVLRPLGPLRPAPARRGLRLVLAGIRVAGVDVLVQVPPLRLLAEDVDVGTASLWVQGAEIEIAAELSGTLGLAVGDVHLPSMPFTLTARELHHQFAPDARQVRATGVALGVPGVRLTVEGTLAATDRLVTDWAARLHIAAAATAPVLGALLPVGALRGLAGRLDATANLAGSSGVVRLALRAAGERLRWRHVAITEARLRGSLVGSRLAVRDARVIAPDLDLAARGAVALLPQAGTLGGEHDVTVMAERLCLRRLLGPFALAPGLLPKGVGFTVHSRGRSFWPMTAEADLDLTATGMPPLPFMPDPFEVHGKLLTHPDAIEIMRLRLGGQGRHLTLQGIVPLQPQGVGEIYQKLHALPE